MSAINRRRGRHAPAYPNWRWLLGQSIETLALEAEREEWVRDAHNWRRSRLAPDAGRETAPTEKAGAFAFPGDAFPVLAANSRREGILALACIAFVHESATFETSRDRAGRNAAGAAATLLQPGISLMPKITWLEPEGGELPFDGDSVGLSCLILATAAVLGLDIPDDLCATGEWCTTDQRCRPVSEETLEIKLRVAKDWGFRRLMVVDGQHGLDGLWPGSGLIRVPPRPAEALPIIVEALVEGQHLDSYRADEALAGVLMVFDRKFVNGSPNDTELDKTLAHTDSILEMAEQRGNPLPLTRFLAHDMRARACLHAGRSAEAEKEAGQAAVNLPPLPWPDGYLGVYLAHEIHAHRAMVAIDLGKWDDAHPVHAQLDRSLAELESDARTRDRMLVASYLRGTRGLHRVFLGRLEGEGMFFGKALSDFRKYGEHALLLANYAVSKLGMGNHGVRRRQNLIIETLEGMKLFAPDAFAENSGLLDSLWPAFVESPEAPVPKSFLASKEQAKQDEYDWTAWMKWRVLKDGGISREAASVMIRNIAERAGAGVTYYPLTKVLETILHYRLVEGDPLAEVSRLLEKAEYFRSDNGDSIFALLAIRGAALLNWDVERPLPRPDPGRRPELHALWTRLRGFDRERRITAVPY